MSVRTHESRLGHHPVIPPRVGRYPGVLSADLVEPFRHMHIADLSDAVGRLYTMSGRLHPLAPQMPRVLGTAMTVKAYPGDNWAVHGALARVTPGTVLVIDWRASDQTCGAGVSALIPAIKNGLQGIVIDGGWRDVAEIEALGFPVIAAGNAPFSPPKTELGELNVPVACDGVIVEPGDLIVGDSDGTVVVPRRHVARVLSAVTRRQQDNSADPQPEAIEDIVTRYWAEIERHETSTQAAD